MNHETQNKILLWVVVIVLLALTLGGFYCGIRISRYKIELTGSDRAYDELAGELRKTTLALGKADEARRDLETGIGAIGAERDALVQQFGILRDAVTGFEHGVAGNEELTEQGLVLVGEVIDILEALAALGLWDRDN